MLGEALNLPELQHWRDPEPRSAAAHMALDETLFAWTAATGRAAARFYHWDRPALTVGYFQDPRIPLPAGAVRRFTGGGLVEHGGDLTFALALPPGGGAALTTAAERYRWIHEALARALDSAGLRVALERPDASAAPGPCFARPVPWDLLDAVTGAKIGGGAQRRSRGAVIHQGSVRLPGPLRHPGAAWIDEFLTGIAARVSPLPAETCARILAESRALEAARYGTEAWNRRKG